MIGRVTTAFAKFDGVDRNRFGGCFSPLGNQIRFRLLSPLRADCFNHLTCLWRVCAKWKKGIALPRCSILVADRERSVPVSEIEGWFVCLVAVTFGALQCGQLAPFRD